MRDLKRVAMPKKKLLLITPMGRNTAMGRDFSLPIQPSAYLVVAVRLMILILPSRDEVVEDIDFDMDVDLVGISAMTPMAMRAHEVA